jgi:hypothetical protein
MFVRWQWSLMKMLKDRQNKSVALAIDTSTNQTRTALISNIVTFFGEMKPDSLLVQSDYKLRSVTPIKEVNIKYYTHGRSSYTEVLEWAEKEKIDALFYITDVTGYFYEELNVDFEVFWLIPDDFIPRVPFGRAITVA